MKHSLPCLAVLALLAAMPLVGRAETQGEGSLLQVLVWDDGPQLGFATGSHTGDPGIAWGWAAEGRFNRWWSIEAGFLTFEDTLQPAFLDGRGLPVNQLDIDAHRLSLTGRLTVWENAKLRFTLGAGLDYLPFNQDDRYISTALREQPAPRPYDDVRVELDYGTGWHASADAEWFITPRWELQVGVRQTMVDLDIDGEFSRLSGASTWTTSAESGNLDYDHLLVRVAINYRF